MARKVYRWRLVPDGGIEHVVVSENEGDVVAEGVIVGGGGASAFGLRYRFVLDADWAGWRSAHVTLVGGITLALRHDGYGGWTDASGQPRPELAGARDLLLGASAFTLAAMIKRIGPKADGKVREGKAVHLAVPTLKAAQSSFTLGVPEAGRIDLGFAEEAARHAIAIDKDGFVADWPGLFERIDLGATPATPDAAAAEPAERVSAEPAEKPAKTGKAGRKTTRASG